MVCVHIKIPISIMAECILTTSAQITKNTYLKPMQQMHQEEMYKYLKMISHSYQTIQILPYSSKLIQFELFLPNKKAG